MSTAVPAEPTVNQAIAADHGLKPDEYQRILDLLGRTPNITELGIFSAMWNEHCSYKSSKKWLRTLPTTGPQVLIGPGENAGVVDIGPSDDGVGLVRGLQDGEPQPPLLYRALSRRGDRRGRHSARRLHHGGATDRGAKRPFLRRAGTIRRRSISCKAWCRESAATATPSACRPSAASCASNAAYNGNCLVNAFAAGLLSTSTRCSRRRPPASAGPVVYLGAKTGRDGVGGATMASAGFDEDIERETAHGSGRRSVSRRNALLEACLELMATGAVVAIQDMGAAGLTCSAVEMGDKGDLGVALNLDAVPTREAGDERL